MRTSFKACKGGVGVVFSVVPLALTFILTGCSDDHSPKPIQKILSGEVAPGVLLVDVLEGGQSQRYWQYEVQPTTGAVRLVKEELFQDYRHRDGMPEAFQKPAGAIQTCALNPQASSPNGQYRAYCKDKGSEEFYLADDNSAKVLYHWKSNKEIRGFAWAPNSNSVAIVCMKGRLGLSPLELLALVSGHPVPHDTIFLDVVDVRTGKMTEYVLRRNVTSAFTRILNWE
jgi:hypothetical protein